MENDSLLTRGPDSNVQDEDHHHHHHHHTDTSFFAFNIHNHLHHFHKARESFRALSIFELIFIFVAVCFVIGGNCGQLIILNLWVNAMGDGIPPPITILTVSATTIMLGYVLCLVGRYVFVLRRQPVPLRTHFGFLLSWKGLALSVIIGLCNSSNGILLVYATGGTPEILQALMLCTQIFWTMLFAKMFLKDPRSFVNPLVILSFLMCAGGIVLGASPQFSSGPGMSANTRNWTFIFAASMIPGALYNVFASMYMRAFTSTKKQTLGEEFVDDSASCSSGSIEGDEEEGHETTNAADGTKVQRRGSGTARDVQSDDTTVKFTMLSTTGLSQVVWMFTLMPLDAVPWFGGSATVQDTATNLSHGWQCVFSPNSLPGCEKAYKYYIMFNVSYFLNYLGSAYLNHYSAALNSMVSQIASPVAAIVLLIAPSLNVDAQPVQVGASIGAVILIMLGSVVYTLWEQGTRHHLK